MKMKSLRMRTTSSMTADKLSSAKRDQKTTLERSNLRMYFPKAEKVLRRGSSLDDQASPQKKDSLSWKGCNNARAKRRHSVDIVTVCSGEVTSKSTQTSHSKVTAPKPETKLKSVNISKPAKSPVAVASKVEPKPILKSTGSFTEKGTSNSYSTIDCEVSDDTRDSPEIRFSYRLPEKRQGALRKTVSFKEESHRIKIKDYSRSRTISSPTVPLDSSDDIFDMDDMTESLVDI